MRHSIGRLALRALCVLALLYLILPARWTRAFFKRTEIQVEPTYITPSPHKLVPNVVHFIRFGNFRMKFFHAVCILAALKNQKPLKLYIHTDQRDFAAVWGKYWEVVVNHSSASGVLEVNYLEMPRSIYGKSFHRGYLYYHASDVERLRILIAYGGIYLDNDSYIVKSLEVFFDHEMTLGWEDEGGGISDQVLIAKKDADFLKLWLDSYRDYRGSEWFYNGGEVPTRILKKHPEIVNAVKTKLAEYKYTLNMLYYFDTDKWKEHYAIHLLLNHQYALTISSLNERLARLSPNASYPVEFDEDNILNYPVTIRQLALDVYPFSAEIKKLYEAQYPHLSSAEHSERGAPLAKKLYTRSMDNNNSSGSNVMGTENLLLFN